MADFFDIRFENIFWWIYQFFFVMIEGAQSLIEWLFTPIDFASFILGGVAFSGFLRPLLGPLNLPSISPVAVILVTAPVILTLVAIKKVVPLA